MTVLLTHCYRVANSLIRTQNLLGLGCLCPLTIPAQPCHRTTPSMTYLIPQFLGPFRYLDVYLTSSPVAIFLFISSSSDYAPFSSLLFVCLVAFMTHTSVSMAGKLPPFSFPPRAPTVPSANFSPSHAPSVLCRLWRTTSVALSTYFSVRCASTALLTPSCYDHLFRAGRQARQTCHSPC